MIDVTEILIHWYSGRSKSEVASSLGVDRKTVRKYVGAAEAAGVMPGGPLVSVEAWAARVREWFPELVAGELRSEVFAELAARHAHIKDAMTLNTLATIHQRLRDEHGLRASLSSLRRYVAVALPEEAMRAKVTVRGNPGGGHNASHIVLPVADGTFGGPGPSMIYPQRPFTPPEVNGFEPGH